MKSTAPTAIIAIAMLTTIAVICLAPSVITAFTGARPSLDPGIVHERADIPVADLSPGVLGRTVWGKAGMIERFDIAENASLKRTTFAGDHVLYILDGIVIVDTGAQSVEMEKADCLHLRGSNEVTLSSAGEDAEVVEISWPVDPDGSAQPRPSSQPTIEPDIVFPRNDIQYGTPYPGIDSQVMTTRFGQFCFLRLMPGVRIPGMTLAEECIMTVDRGEMDVTSAGSQGRMSSGSTLILESGMSFEGEAGPEGCDVIAAFSPANPLLARAHEERMRAFGKVFDIAAEAEILVDGNTHPAGLTFTEGPSWMDGVFYFSNYYKFWKEWGSSDEGGLWAVYPDGSAVILNKNVQTCGTTPLPNGNLAVCDLIDIGLKEFTPEGREVGVIVDSYEEKPFGIVNDVITDRKGGIYFTDSSKKKEEPRQPGTALYYLASDGTLSRVTEPDAVEYINGIALTPDDSMLFLNGSGEEYVFAFDVAGNGMLSNKRPFARLRLPDSQLARGQRRSVADGMTIDAEGRLCVATALGVQVFDPAGGFIGIIRLPVQPSHCVFGGDDYSWLHLTTRDSTHRIRTRMRGFQYPLPPLE